MNTLILDKVILEIDSNQLLNDITFKAREGRIHCILGPNGAGKTLTNKIVGLLYKVTGGTVKFNDEVINPWNTEDDRVRYIKKIGLMWQKPVFLSSSVYSNLEYPLKLRDTPKKEINVKVNKWLDLVDLTEHRDKNPNKLSIGQQQKLSLARTFISEPEIIILDEPAASLDAATSKWLERFIKEQTRLNNLIVIWNSHDLFQVKRVADDVSILIDGEIVETASKSDIFDNPVDIRVKKFTNGELL